MSKRVEQFTEDTNILKLILIASLPAVVSGLVDTFYNTVDSIFVGQHVGNEGLAALSVINVIQLLFIALGVLFSVGNASIISRALGAHHVERAQSSLTHSFWGLFLFSSAISLSILINLDAFLPLIGASGKTLPYAKSYGGIILWTGFFLPINNVLLGAFRAKGEALHATYLNVLGAFLNIALDALFIIVFKWGVAGAAFATAISQGIVFICSVVKIKKLYNITFLFHNKEQISLPLLKEIVYIGMPTGLRLVLFVGVFSIVNNILVDYGDEYLSALGVFNRLVMLMAMINVSLSIGAQPLIGMNFGAKLYKRVRKFILYTMNLGLIISILASIFLWYAPHWAYAVFTSDAKIIAICQEMSKHQSYTYIGWGLFICIAEALQAMGHAKESFWLSMTYPISVVIASLVFEKFWGVQGFYWAFPFSYLLIGIASIVLLFREFYRLHKKEESLKNLMFR